MSFEAALSWLWKSISAKSRAPLTTCGFNNAKCPFMDCSIIFTAPKDDPNLGFLVTQQNSIAVNSILTLSSVFLRAILNTVIPIIRGNGLFVTEKILKTSLSTRSQISCVLPFVQLWLLRRDFRIMKLMPPLCADQERKIQKRLRVAYKRTVKRSDVNTKNLTTIRSQCQRKKIIAKKREIKQFVKSFVLAKNFVIWGPLEANFTVSSCLNTLERGAIAYNVFEPTSSPAVMLSEENLSVGGLRMLREPNAGGSSVASEVLSYEMLRCCYGASLIATETQLQYEWGSKITDYSCSINGHVYGVSVTRLIDFDDLRKNFKSCFTEESIVKLLTKKLRGVLLSTAGVYEQFKWEKQILHVWATSHYARQALEDVYQNIDPELKANTLVLVSVAANSPWIF
eukprot:TRINITY_DN11807_c0_g1_i1.p1 TRINITY_DN11807_c0_g1~~TRINITY_DN11807_c0_g1_i1.p1  ORF type:complete len:398 (+),score=63.18 TRINITY_DN11807_c0_g1_i1:414-1607(+)